MKKISLSLLIGAAIVSTSMQAFWGAAYYATKGPSIPKIMKIGQKFLQQHGKGVVLPHLNEGDQVISNHPNIIDVTNHDGHIEVVALNVGTATISIKKPSGKIRKERTITVAYQNLKDAFNDVKSSVCVGDKLFIAASENREEATITIADNAVAKKLRVRSGDQRFHEIRFHTAGKVVISQHGQAYTFTVEHKKNHSKNHSKNHEKDSKKRSCKKEAKCDFKKSVKQKMTENN